MTESRQKRMPRWRWSEASAIIAAWTKTARSLLVEQRRGTPFTRGMPRSVAVLRGLGCLGYHGCACQSCFLACRALFVALVGSAYATHQAGKHTRAGIGTKFGSYHGRGPQCSSTVRTYLSTGYGDYRLGFYSSTTVRTRPSTQRHDLSPSSVVPISVVAERSRNKQYGDQRRRRMILPYIDIVGQPAG